MSKFSRVTSTSKRTKRELSVTQWERQLLDTRYELRTLDPSNTDRIAKAQAKLDELMADNPYGDTLPYRLQED